LKTENSADGVTVSVPANAPNDISSTVVLKIKGAPEVAATLLKQNADGSITLRAADADLHGGLQYEVGNGKNNIGYWTNPNDFASWTFQIIHQPGKFRVTAEVATQGAADFEISSGDEKISAAAPNTGDYTHFQTIDLPVVFEIPASGNATLTVKPVKENWSPVNLKSITLTPAN
jgi:alpha-L-fucosidase